MDWKEFLKPSPGKVYLAVFLIILSAIVPYLLVFAAFDTGALRIIAYFFAYTVSLPSTLISPFTSIHMNKLILILLNLIVIPYNYILSCVVITLFKKSKK
jgi:hypothetical protein